MSIRRPRLFLLAGTISAALVLAQVGGPRAAHADGCDNEYSEVEECEADVGGDSGIVGPTRIDPNRPQRGRIRISTDRSFYYVGDYIRICFSLPAPGYIQIIDDQPNGRRAVLWEWYDDGRGNCMWGTITPPAGRECVRLSYSAYGRGRRQFVSKCFGVGF